MNARLPARAGAAVREAALVVAVFVAYQLGRHLVRAREETAFDGAELLLSLQKNLPLLPRERTVQELLLRSDELVVAANWFYVGVHFPATVAFLLYLWLRQPAAYAWGRSLLVVTTGVALLVHLAFPLAPPRMLPQRGFVDTMAVYGPTAYGDGTEELANQFAAMPSLHAAWAVVVALVLVTVIRSRWRWLALAHPVLTTLVVVGTANHYWADIAAGVVLVLLAVLVVGRVPALAGVPRPRTSSARETVGSARTGDPVSSV